MPVGIGIGGGDDWSPRCRRGRAARATGSRKRAARKRRRHRAAGRPVQQFDGVHDRRLAKRADLHHAAEIAGRDDVRIDAGDMRGLAFASAAAISGCSRL